jgi:nitrate/TMAO reductase-like tetraheme cytochrome c subunit
VAVRRRRLALAAAASVAVVLGLSLAAALTVSRLEERDSFCISCHTRPEVTYHERAQRALAGPAGEIYDDLSSAHYGMESTFRCIDCHRGDQGPLHRVTTLALAARDTVVWVSGQADDSIEKTDLVAPGLSTAACTRCHGESLLEVGFNNHFHNKLPEAYRLWREGAELRPPMETLESPASALVVEPSPTDVLCVDCHRAHTHRPGSELQAYLDLANTVYPACVRCHEEAGHGPLELARR